MPPSRESRIPRPDAPGPAPAREKPAIRFLKKIGPARMETLRRAGIETPADLLVHYPRTHEDRRKVRTVDSLRDGDEAVVRVRVLDIALLGVPRHLVGRNRRKIRGRSLVRVRCADDTGVLHLDLWNQPWREDQYEVGSEMLVWGKAARRGRIVFTRPESVVLRDAAGNESPPDPLSWGRIVPVYPRLEKIPQGDLRAAIADALAKHGGDLPDPIPPEEAKGMDLPPLREAVTRIHFPETPEDLAVARKRLEFEELLLFQTALALRRRSLVRESRGFAYALGADLDRRIRARFPFALTGDQDRAVADILADLKGPHPMNRLLQGDVGSGKTAVALYAMLAAVANRRQAAILAPTEILAEQHHRNFGRALEGSRVRVGFLAGRAPAKERRALVKGVADGSIQVVVATHAVLESDVRFRDLGVAVVDEQHRFGVRQRSVFREKGMRPDLLYLTATPIPRTLALSLYGDLDVSVLAERPPGRHPVRTVAVDPLEEAAAHELVRRECAAGRQAFFVCPLVEETKKQDLRAAKQEAERLRDEVYPGLGVGLLHGRMKSAEKHAVMDAFRAGRIRVLVSTVVIEVGVDVPNASVLAVLHAERFGLTQLHQLRGRIGRGPHPSHCLLFTGPLPAGSDARGRIDAMLDTDDGFRIAEWDLRLRGFGEIFGTRQSGVPDLRFPEALLNGPLLDRARRAAAGIVERDPGLEAPSHGTLRTAVLRRFGLHLDLVRV